jgi:hypothetical protein
MFNEEERGIPPRQPRVSQKGISENTVGLNQ